MTAASTVVLFGDQTGDPVPLIKQLYRQSRRSSSVKSFLESAYLTIRQELAVIELSDRAKFPSFDSISALAQTYSQSDEHDEAVSTVLNSVAQLGLLVS